MSYLIPKDYNKQIQADNLIQIIGSDLSIQGAAELAAIEEASSYLVQKYELTKEFQDVLKFDKSVSYKAGNRVYLDFPAYSPTTTYNIGDTVTNSGTEYICTSTTTDAFDVTKWKSLGAQYIIFNAKLPFEEFNLTKGYKPGDTVYWKNNTYTCKIASTWISHEAALQYGQYQYIPYINVFPDDPNLGVSYWGNPTAYTVPANTSIDNATYWVAGDTRSQQLVAYVIDTVLYHLHSRIAPRNIPDLRVKRYDDAVKWFKACAKGDVTPNLPMLQPRQGARVRYGGNIKNQNSY